MTNLFKGGQSHTDEGLRGDGIIAAIALFGLLLMVCVIVIVMLVRVCGG